MRFLLIFVAFIYKSLIVGDSISCHKFGWQTLLGRQIYNISQVGKTTDWMLYNLEYSLSKEKFEKIYIYGGINDIFSESNKDPFQNIQKMVNLCNRYKIKPIVIIGYDIRKLSKKDKSKREAYFQYQQKLLLIKGAHIVPIDTNITKIDSEDGIHLTTKGQEKFANWVNSH